MPTATEVSREVDLTGFLSRLGGKERTKVEKHLAACDTENDPDRAKLWRRVATMLDSSAGAGVESAGGQAWRFFIPDGKYRMQVFAMEDRGDGTLRVFLPDILDEAVKSRVMSKTKVPNEYIVKGSRDPIHVIALEPSKIQDPPAHIKPMLGWNRKALEITLRTAGGGTQTLAAQALVDLAARKWVRRD